jgi:hypothetical protein
MNALICGVGHAAEPPPNPVVVNISTVNCRDSRNVLDSASNVCIPHWYVSAVTTNTPIRNRRYPTERRCHVFTT